MPFLCLLSAVTASNALLDWVIGLGGRVGPVSVRPSACGDGNGLYLSRNVSAGEFLFAVPRSATISLPDALEHPSYGDTLANAWSDLIRENKVEQLGMMHDAALAGLLAYEMLDGGVEGRWQAYLDMLPKAKSQGHMLWWRPEEVALLEGTSVHEECVTLRQTVADASALLSENILKGSVEAHGQSAVDDAIVAAYVTLTSHGFDENFGNILIPLLDLLQATSLVHPRCRVLQMSHAKYVSHAKYMARVECIYMSHAQYVAFDLSSL